MLARAGMTSLRPQQIKEPVNLEFCIQWNNNNDGGIKTFPCRQKLKEFISNKSELQQMLKRSSETEGKEKI